ncbi:molybdate ABC transporter substrate-binding protein [Cytobacillus sp. FJAT-54145]|uniref:Molybdate ABC transporter substrate-binding protein n=1 Tax=Cytobacillus spartinae TaxID=3299023 RepID=A0ABW6K9J7_9BACI
MTRQLQYICLAALILLITACAPDQSQPKKVTLTVSAAASLNSTLTEIKTMFEEQHQNIEIIFNFAGSGSLQQQIRQGAPVDIFISASEEHFDQLVKEKLIDAELNTDLVGNQLVLIFPKTSSITSFKDLAQNEVKKIAIGIPETVPAGYYTKQTFQSLNLWEKVQPKLVMAKDVRQVLTYVETGNVDAGIVYVTDARQSTKVEMISQDDQSLHDSIIYPMGVVGSSKHPEEAQLFYEYLQSEQAQQVFEKFGFIVLE